MITLPSAKGRTYGIIKDPYYSAVSLLLHMNGANGSTTFTDSSPNNLTVTPNGSIAISTTQSKFGGASAYFDGTGDYLSFTGGMPSGAGTEFTIECWVRLDDLADYRMITRTVGGIDFYVVPDGSISVGRSGVVGIAASATGLITAGTWYHIALTRDTSNNYKIYINGVQVASGTNSFSVTAATTIGYSEYSGSHYFKGYIDDLRITKGVSRYNSNFTPPIRPYPDYEEAIPADPYYSSTSLLLHMDGTNNSTTFIDSGPSAIAVTANGNAKISTTQSKFGGTSGYFDGAGDYLSATSNACSFGTGDFTVEFWFQAAAISTDYQHVVGDLANSTTMGFGFYNRIYATTINAGYSGTTFLNANQWYHYACVRQSGVMKLYLNGVVDATFSVSTNLSNTSFTVGMQGGTLYPLNGYIDDLRITKGVARYNSNFTPPTKAYPNVYNPYASLPVNGAILWLDASKHSSLFTDAGSTNVKNNGDLVYQWNDLSGANNHATQSTSGSRPSWSSPANGQNGFGAVGFNGVNQLISTATSGLSAQPFEYYIVFKFNSTATFDRIVYGAGDRGNFDGNSGGGWNLWAGALLTGGTRTGTSWTMANCKFNGSSSVLRINASQVLSGNPGTGYPTAFSLGGNGSTDPGDITVAEFVVYPSTLSAGDQNLVESYLKTKWGTA